jgi:electron transfer flavoprotein beta subunit
LNIVALVKYSLDVAEVKVDPSTCEVLTAGVPRRVGNIDKNVVEGAVRLKEAAEAGTTLRILSLGPLAARDAFKDVLAMGADEVILIEDPFGGQAEGGVAVRLLEAALRHLAPIDVIVCGFASDDGYTHQVPPRLAERLDLPLVASVRSMVIQGRTLTAEQDLDDCVQGVSVELPAIVSVDEEAFAPRRTTLLEALKAKQKPVHIWNAESELGLALADLEAAVHIVDVKVTGVVVQRRQQVLQGSDMAELAGRFLDALADTGMITRGAP